tara:strand:+ start:4645 stop:5637 length:993 start_codon:yes stop_codon:yes gene_type:complete
MYNLIVIGATSDICRNKVYKNINSLGFLNKIYCYGWENWKTSDLQDYFLNDVKGDISNLIGKIEFVKGDYNDYSITLRHLIDCNTIVYVATPPLCYKKIIHDLGCTEGKLVFEKPFASNSDEFNDISKYVTQNVYLMDHFLYKSDINNVISKYRNKDINYIGFHFLYSDDVEKRLGYFDKSGLFKDMFQCHYLSTVYRLLGEKTKNLLDADIIKNTRKQYVNYGGSKDTDTYFYLELVCDGCRCVFESGKASRDKREIVVNNERFTINSYEDEYTHFFNGLIYDKYSSVLEQQDLFWKIFNKYDNDYKNNGTLSYYHKYDKYNHIGHELQ